MKNRTSTYIVSGLIVLAIFGFAFKLFTDPLSILITLATIALVGALIYFLVTRLTTSGSGRQQQRAFQKAAKRSKKRFQTKDANASSKRSKIRSLASARNKTKDASHLTVIEGKKNRKKNRASF
ncbi:SA1362 family protein [Mesobacillus selenatarsenatis]|uniref:Permeases of the drug/metabolite transporter (DMT) superfamily n=1 Tax=Mesobacillus selenatarsenatis (strain DSM 18680 / JCM 14380 / FERM P-15431 / SF-1) TaxID=1321606 RepID=A0A0A8X5U6_MESS1|nr:SA1362 family protein [Mesobacillus selenatarsenatis]GAM15340.1 unknown [Mesobacillus selenatarsenatis SF-1]